MKAKEYWNIPEAGKRRRIRSIPYFVFYALIAYFGYLFISENMMVVLIIVALALWVFLKVISDSLRMVSRPVCRLTDEFIILDYDRNVTPWDMVTRIVATPRKKTVKVYYPGVNRALYKSSSDSFALVRGKWMQDWDSFLADLAAECETRSIPFTTS